MKKNIIMLVFFVGLFFTISTRYNLNKLEINLDNYHINVDKKRAFLVNERIGVVYNQELKLLEKIEFILHIQGKLIEQRVALDLNKISNKDIHKNIQTMIVDTKNYIQRENGKYFFLDKEKGLKVFDIASKQIPAI